MRGVFVAVIATNLPVAFNLIRGMLGPVFISTRKPLHEVRQQQGRNGHRLATIGGGNGGGEGMSKRKRAAADPLATDMIFSACEERNKTSPLQN